MWRIIQSICIQIHSFIGWPSWLYIHSTIFVLKYEAQCIALQKEVMVRQQLRYFKLDFTLIKSATIYQKGSLHKETMRSSNHIDFQI